MAHSKLYRSFIILQEDERGHSIASDKPLSGYAKVEVKNDKCKVAFYAQNIKKDYGKCNMILICGKKDTEILLNLGTMNINPQGKAEISVEFDANNIGNTGVSYDKVVGASLCKIDGSAMKFMMCGFLNGEKPTSNWKAYKKVECAGSENKKMEEIKPIGVKKKEEPKSVTTEPYESKKKEEPTSVAEKTSDAKVVGETGTGNKKPTGSNEDSTLGSKCGCTKSRSKYEQYEEYIDNSDLENGQSDLQEERHDAEEERNDVEEERNNLEEGQIGKYTYPENDDDFELRGTVGDFFESVVDSLERTKGSKEIKKCKWYKVPVKSFDTMCNIGDYNKYTALYYPMTNYYPYIAKEGHFLVGLKCDEYGTVKYLVYGIKGKKDRKNQPYDGKTGFVTWTPLTDEGLDMGYWLMFYDFKNSVVVVPSR